ncbi:MAG: hypothetical protein EZS28_049788, partial [Streblomastix strix]
MLDVYPLQPKEKAGYAWRALESSAAVVQRVAGITHKVARTNTDILVGKMFKVFEAAVVSLSNEQVEMESTLEGLHQGPQTEEVLSQRTRERFKRQPTTQTIVGRRGYGNTFKGHQVSLEAESFKITITETTIYCQHHFTILCRLTSRPEYQQGSIDMHKIIARNSISSNSVQQVVTMFWQQVSFDTTQNDIETVSWENTSFDQAKDTEKAGCVDQKSADCAINNVGKAESED